MGEPLTGDSPRSWLLLCYRVPSQPTRIRATIWRRVRSLGAIYLQHGVVAIPATRDSERALRLLHHLIEEEQGTSVLVDASVIAGERSLRAAYDGVRDEEFHALAERVRALADQIEHDLDGGRRSYSVLAGHDRRLGELRRAFASIEANDWFGAAACSEAARALERTEDALSRLADAVYAAEAQP